MSFSTFYLFVFFTSDRYKLKAALSKQLIVSVKGYGEMEGKDTNWVERGREILGKWITRLAKEQGELC